MTRTSKIGIGVGVFIIVLLAVGGLLWQNMSDQKYATSGYSGGSQMMENYDIVDSPMVALDSDISESRKIDGEDMYSNPQITVDSSQDRLIIKTGNMSVVVPDVRKAVDTVSEYAVQKGGFVVESNVEKTGLVLYGSVTVRIPVASFDKGVEDMKSLGEVTSQNMSGQDVTEEYIDLDAQIKNLRATENQFLEIMKKAQDIEDILAVQKELTWVRGEIDRIDGRMKYLEKSADLSTLTVYLSTDPNQLPVLDESDTWRPWAKVKEAARSLVDVGKGLVTLLIWVVIYVPFWLFLVFVIWLVVKGIKKIVHRRSEDKQL